MPKVFSWFYKSYFKQNRKPIIHFPVYHYFTLWRHNNGFRNRDPVTPDLPLNIKLNFVTLDFDSVAAHVNFGMLTVSKR
jgi:ABC-type cobalamin transport system ATPase subunit